MRTLFLLLISCSVFGQTTSQEYVELAKKKIEKNLWADDYLSKAKQLDSNNAAVYILAAPYYMKNQQWDNGIRNYKKLLSINSNDTLACEEIARAYINLFQPSHTLLPDERPYSLLKSALEYCNKGLAIDKERSNLYYYRSLCNYELGNYQESLKDMIDFDKRGGKKENASNLRADIYSKLKK